MINSQALQIVEEDSWPPDQPKSFIPLLLIHHQQLRTRIQITEMTKLIQKGNLDSFIEGKLTSNQANLETVQHILSTSTVTDKIAEILLPLENDTSQKFILIEGAPGIGKSVLLKHIAIEWAKNILLCKYKIVLLACLRDPNIQKIMTIQDLFKLVCKGDARAPHIASKCNDYVFANGGEDLAFLFDGYDELPQELQKCGLIADILNRRVLPHCGLVVSSRPHASGKFRSRAFITVDILGFPKEQRHQYVEQVLEKQSCKIDKLTQYLHQNPSIDNLCYVPFNLMVLLFLYNLGFHLPESSTNLYSYFVCQTILHNLKKVNAKLKNTNITDLTKFPKKYDNIIKQLAALSLEGLNNNKLIFTSDEIKKLCPGVISTEDAINGFGLLQTVRHLGLHQEELTFNFLHITIQEYLAAYYIINYLQPEEEQKLLLDKFESDLHANMFYIYVTLTKGQRIPFKSFLADGDSKIAISNKFLQNQIKCFRLFRCFHEAGDKKMCEAIENAAIFNDKEIKINSKPSASDLESIAVFLASSSQKQWAKLELSRCLIQDHGIYIIHKFLINRDVVISELTLDYNGLTHSSSSLISEIVLNCKVAKLSLMGNHTIGDSKDLYAILYHPNSVLNHLYIDYTELSSTSAKVLFSAVKESEKLQCLITSWNNIDDDVVDVVATALTTNTSLETLWMDHNPIGGETIMHILQAILKNDGSKLSQLVVPSCTEMENVQEQRNKVNKLREKEGKKELSIDFM